MKRLYLIILTAVLAALPLRAQNVTVDASIDSLQILIGEQAHIKLEVSMDAGQRAEFPQYKDTLVTGIELVEQAKPDTQLLNNGKRMLITRQYTVTSWDSALYYLPPIPVKVGNETYLSNALALAVYTMPVDTLHPDQFFGPKGVMKPDFVWSDWYLFIFCCLALIPLALLLVYLVKRIRDNQPIIRKVKVEPKLPPHEKALQEMNRIKSERVWQAGETKEYYTQLTEVIRNYIRERFGFNAMEMTSDEIIEHLLTEKDEAAIAELRQLFATADLVKFAKFNPMMNENDANLITAVKFVNDTKEEADPNAKPEPTEITIVEKRPLRTKVLLGVGIALIVVALALALKYIVTELLTII